MTDEEVSSQIRYLDDFRADDARSFVRASGDITELVRAIIQVELARQAAWNSNAELSARLASVEGQMQRVLKDVARQRNSSAVQYVTSSQTSSQITDTPRVGGPPKLPRSIIVFYSAGLVCSLAFAVLLVLSSTGLNVIHPFVSVIGFIGGLGWLTTAWTDLLLWKRDIIPSDGSRPSKENHVAA